MRFVSFLKRVTLWLFRRVFSKKFILSVAALLVILVSAICLTHYFYNKHAWEHWDALETRVTESYDLDSEGRFYEVESELDFFDDPFIKDYLARHSESDDQGLSDVMEVILSQNDELYYGAEPDIRKWIKDVEFETEKEAAEAILALIEPLAEDARGVANALRSRPTTSAALTRELTLNSFMIQEDSRSLMHIIGFSRFYNTRAKLHIHREDSAAGFADLKLCMELSEVGGRDSSLLAFLLNLSMEADVFDVVSFGISKHVWSEEQLEQIEVYTRGRNAVEGYKEFLPSEFVYNQQIVNLIREHGYVTVMAEMRQGVEGFVDSLFNSIGGVDEDQPWIDVDALMEVASLYVVPEGVMIRNVAIPHAYGIDILTPVLQQDVHVTVLRELRNEIPKFTWYESSAESLVKAFVNQYEVLLKAVAQQRMTLVACRLEKDYITKRQYPQSLVELDLGSDISVKDPYSENSLIYENLGDGSFSLHSIGLQQEDLPESRRHYYNAEEQMLKFFSDTSL